MADAYEISEDVTTSDSKLLQERHIYKPFLYPWCFEAWQTQQRIHWIPEEVPLAEDVRDWRKNLNPAEKHLITQIFRFFTQADVEVNNCYMKHYSRVFGPVEVQMMLAAFSNIETIHIAAYSYLLDTIGMPESEYSAFLEYKAMKDKFDYLQNASMANRRDIAKTMAMFGAFTEGVALFASFAILMNFPRFNKMKGMGQIITWSVRDETLHCLSMIRLFKEFINENPDIWDDELRAEILETCKLTVEHEDAFIDLCFEMGDIEGLTADEIKQYIRYISDRRLQQLGMDAYYNVTKNPLPWMDEILNGAEHANFFESRATEYAKAATEGSWEDAFSEDVFAGNYGQKIGGITNQADIEALGDESDEDAA